VSVQVSELLEEQQDSDRDQREGKGDVHASFAGHPRGSWVWGWLRRYGFGGSWRWTRIRMRWPPTWITVSGPLPSACQKAAFPFTRPLTCSVKSLVNECQVSGESYSTRAAASAGSVISTF